MHATRKILPLAFCMALAACSGGPGVDSVRPPLNTQFEDWCEAKPCGWTVKAGSTQRTITWHEHTSAVELVGEPSEISQRASRPSGTCMRIEVVARSDQDALLQLSLDFDGDGLEDLPLAIPSGGWKRHSFILHPPVSYAVVVYTFKKSGPGSAAIASLATSDADQLCYDRIRLEPKSFCLSDDSCKIGHRCVDGVCALCMDEACEQDAACDDDRQCRSGACAGGRCSDCAATSSCPARAPCSSSSQCQSGSCVFGSLPSAATRPGFDGVCAECSNDGQCTSGRCVLGFCSACASDEQCAGLSCRYGDAIDAVDRACRAPEGSKRTRGQLCERDEDCEGLACGAGPGRAKRCGISCGDHSDCGEGLCGAPATRTLPRSSERVVIPSRFAKPEARVRTCYPKPTLDFTCTVDEQCPELRSACCEGVCKNSMIDRNDAMCTNEYAEL